MPKFVKKTLSKLQHSPPLKPQHSPHDWIKPTFTSKPQLSTTDTSPLLPTSKISKIQSIAGSFLYYGRAVDPTILPAVNEIGITQATPTTATEAKCKKLCDYVCTHPSSTLRFKASDMCLYIDTDAAYLVAPNSKSRVAGYFYLSDHSNNIKYTPTFNAAIHVEC